MQLPPIPNPTAPLRHVAGFQQAPAPLSASIVCPARNVSNRCCFLYCMPVRSDLLAAGCCTAALHPDTYTTLMCVNIQANFINCHMTMQRNSRHTTAMQFLVYRHAIPCFSRRILARPQSPTSMAHLITPDQLCCIPHGKQAIHPFFTVAAKQAGKLLKIRQAREPNNYQLWYTRALQMVAWCWSWL